MLETYSIGLVELPVVVVSHPALELSITGTHIDTTIAKIAFDFAQPDNTIASSTYNRSCFIKWYVIFRSHFSSCILAAVLHQYRYRSVMAYAKYEETFVNKIVTLLTLSA